MHVLTDWLLTSARAAIHVPTRTAVVADLHLGYNEARRRGGESLPCFDIARDLQPLSALLSAANVRRLVIAGDLVEDAFDDSVIGDFQRWLERTGGELAGIVPGNHDRGFDRYAGCLPLCPEGIRLGRWHIVHGDAPPGDIPTVHGHVHPCVRWHGRRCPCYLVGTNRLILPAYSQDAKGANIAKDPFLHIYRPMAIVGNRLIPVEKTAVRSRQPARDY